MSFDRIPGPPGRPGLAQGQTPQTRINEQIRITPLLVIDADGTKLGVIPRDQALEIARRQELDLVEVSATERPPVCKIMDYGKFKFEQTKRQRKQKSSQQQLKEVRFRPSCGQADLETKLKHAREFLEEKHKVSFVVQLRGRENIYVDGAIAMVNRLMEQLADISKIERRPTRDGKRITAVLSPK